MDNSQPGLQITQNIVIPYSELKYSFERSRGPGGQHVNRAHTAVVLTFSINNSSAFNSAQKQRLISRLKNMLSHKGELRLFCDSFRSQWQNKNEVTERFQILVRKALEKQKKRIPTKPSRAAKQKRIDAKKLRSTIKNTRKQIRPYDEG